MRERLLWLNGMDRLAGRDQALAWGFPREVHEQELVLGFWFSLGSDAVFWLTPDLDCKPGDMSVHVATRKDTTRWERIVQWQQALYFIGDTLTLYRVLAKPQPEFTSAGPILARLGWTHADGWWYLSVKERSDAAEAPADEPRLAGGSPDR